MAFCTGGCVAGPAIAAVIARQLLLHTRHQTRSPECRLHPHVLDKALPCVAAASLALASSWGLRRHRIVQSLIERSNFYMAQNGSKKLLWRHVRSVCGSMVASNMHLWYPAPAWCIVGRGPCTAFSASVLVAAGSEIA
jgi:hypothetical protein